MQKLYLYMLLFILTFLYFVFFILFVFPLEKEACFWYTEEVSVFSCWEKLEYVA